VAATPKPDGTPGELPETDGAIKDGRTAKGGGSGVLGPAGGDRLTSPSWKLQAQAAVVTPPPSPFPSPWPERDAHHLLVTAEQMLALEAELFASGLPVEALMEKAGLALGRRILELGQPRRAGQQSALAGLGEGLRGRGALVLVGPGHNGGDGLVVARELHLAGVPVRLWSPFERRKPLAERHWRHARWLGIPLLEQRPDPSEPCLWIDALFGNGQRRPPGDDLETLLQQRQARQPGRLLAIDGPTGLCSDTGRLLGRQAARAALTLCLGLIRQGLVQDSALDWVGELERIDLGLPPALLNGLPLDQPLGLGGPGRGRTDAEQAPRPAPALAAGKYQRGRLLVIAGSARYPGAAHLALAGASASGCGSLRAVLPGMVAEQLWTVLPHVVPEPDPLGGAGGERLDAVLVGPGLGPAAGADDAGAAREEELWQRLRGFAGTLVLDADGLNRISGNWLIRRAGPTWITPHATEFERLFPDLAELPPLAAAAAAADLCGATVLLKGARTVVAAADGRRWQVLRSCPEAARAGLGDVLAGYAAGLAALGHGCGGADGSLLALAALDHALAGCRAKELQGTGGVTPLAVARQLERAQERSAVDGEAR
jgi:NAD(P)H-hydrate epimerase